MALWSSVLDQCTSTFSMARHNSHSTPSCTSAPTPAIPNLQTVVFQNANQRRVSKMLIRCTTHTHTHALAIVTRTLTWTENQGEFDFLMSIHLYTWEIYRRLFWYVCYCSHHIVSFTEEVFPQSLSYPWFPLIIQDPIDQMDLFVLAADLYIDIAEKILLKNSDDTQLSMKCLSGIQHFLWCPIWYAINML